MKMSQLLLKSQNRSYTGEELPGAKLKVSDSEGNVVDEWTSGSTPHIIKELEVERNIH